MQLSVGLAGQMDEENTAPGQNLVPPPGELNLGILREDIGFQIHITRRALTQSLRTWRRGRRKREPSGYLSSLILIGENPGISQREIAEVLLLDPPNLATMLNSMVADRLIVRTQDETDRRRFSLKLTAAGEERLKMTKEFSRTQMKRYADAMTPAEMKQLTSLLAKVQACLKSG